MAKKYILFCDYYDEWVETYKFGAIKDVTLNKYYMTGTRLREICPRLFLDELDRREYQRIINEYAKTHEKQTVMDFHHQVKGCILDAFHDGLIKRDPTYKTIIKGKNPRVKKRKFLHNEELKKLISTLDLGTHINMDWFTMIVAKTGLRFAEALALTPNDFDFAKQTLTVNKTLDYKSTKPSFQPTKNESSNRKIVIDWQLVGQFQPLLANLNPNETIFVTEGVRIFNSTYNNFLKRKCLEAGIEVVSMHSLRHTHASVLLAAGVSIHSIADRLGHADVSTTQETYTHIINELAEKDNSKMIGALTTLV
ncbi:site-specific integrase [Amphibacillus sp. Q70]|uniref:site-specific integrase n=1 Tax=Amphibacillus sp. Q70 TaxID=3453416 RepID=UPI003F840BA9